MSHPRDQAALERGRRFMFVAGVLAVAVGVAHAYEAMKSGQSPWPALLFIPLLIALLWGWHAFLTRRQPNGALPTQEQVKARSQRASRPLHRVSLAVTIATIALAYLLARLR